MTEARLVASDGREVEALETPGEVLLKAPNLFKGYLGNDQATKESIDNDGWLRTGDIGMFKKGPNGAEHLFILDRIKEMIKVKGLQVVPIDIELVLREHPAIADVAVIGVPDENAGERAKAFVVRSELVKPETNEDDLKEAIDEYVQDRLDESHWLHDRIVFVVKLPKSQSGKVLKRELRALCAA
jgi:acyl-CoA synthetase (AMP-forming)/AMP-acid ligase II